MNKYSKGVFLFAGVLFFVLSGFALAQDNAAKQEKQFTSFWEGKLKIGAVSLRRVLKTFKNSDGSLGAAMDSPDQSVKDIPISSITFTDDSLKFESKEVKGTYAGKFYKDSMLVKGKWNQGTLSLPLDLKKIDKPEEPKRPQLPQKPYPYNDEDVTFENKTANIILAGSFTFPKGEGKFPAVVLVTGSGPQDRDETIFNHKPFLVIADYLTRNGIAVLRFDDRGIAKSKGNFASATTEDFVTDALAAVEYLKTRKEVDQKKIGVAGHSEGGIIAPMTAANSNDVNFIILLAGTGLPGKELMVLQTKLVMKAEGSKEEDIEKVAQLNSKIYNLVSDEPDSTMVVKKLREMFDEELSKMSAEEKKNPEQSKAAFERSITQVTSPWFRFFMKYDPRPTLENVHVSVLALNGGNDVQVPPKEDLSEIEKALKAGGNKNYKIVELPGLNHLFQHCKKCSVAEYGELEETFSPDALKIIKDWILEVTK